MAVGPAVANADGSTSELYKHPCLIPEPARWPGGCDPSLDRPDRVKFDLGTFATRKPPGRLKCNQLGAGIRKGLMGDSRWRAWCRPRRSTRGCSGSTFR